MTILTLIAIANTVTFGVTTFAAVKRPVGSYILIAAIPLCAWVSSLYQAATRTGMFIANILTGLSLVLIVWRIALDARRAAKE